MRLLRVVEGHHHSLETLSCETLCSGFSACRFQCCWSSISPAFSDVAPLAARGLEPVTQLGRRPKAGLLLGLVPTVTSRRTRARSEPQRDNRHSILASHAWLDPPRGGSGLMKTRTFPWLPAIQSRRTRSYPPPGCGSFSFQTCLSDKSGPRRSRGPVVPLGNRNVVRPSLRRSALSRRYRSASGLQHTPRRASFAEGLPPWAA